MSRESVRRAGARRPPRSVSGVLSNPTKREGMKREGHPGNVFETSRLVTAPDSESAAQPRLRNVERFGEETFLRPLNSLLSLRTSSAVRSYSFDALADRFDETRTIDPSSFDRSVAYLVKRIPPARFPRMLEIGVGTGRIATPLAARGYQVVGVDIAVRMLERAAGHQSQRAPNRVALLLADGTKLPFRSGTFDVVYWAHVLHLIPEWRRALDEALRCLRPGGVLVGMGTGRGREIPRMFRQYQRIARAHGYSRPRLGARRRETVFRFPARRGCAIQTVSIEWRWETHVPVQEALDDIQARSYAAVRFTPARVHSKIMVELRRWCRVRWVGKNPTVAVPSAISFQLAVQKGRTDLRRKSPRSIADERQKVPRTQKS